MGDATQTSNWIWPAAAVAVCALLTAVMRVSFDSFAVFLLPLADNFGWDRAETAGIYGTLMLFFGIGSPIAGRLMDWWGPRWTYVTGAAIIAAAFHFTASASALWHFYLTIGVAVGLGGALIGLVSHATLLARWFHANLTIAIAVSAAASGVGLLIFAPLIQLLIDGSGWRAAYSTLSWVAILLTAFLFVLPWRELSGPSGPAPAVSHSRDPDVYEPATDELPPHTATQAYRNSRFWALFSIQFLTAFSMFTLNPQIVAFLIENGFDPVAAASAFGATGLAGTVGLIAFAWLADRRGRGLAMTLSYGMTIAGFSLLLAIMAVPVWGLVGLFIIIYGPTFGSRGPIVNALVPRLFGRGPHLGLIMGSVQLGMGAGAALGATFGGYLHDINGYAAVIALAIAANIGALALYWSVGNIRNA